ncbi:DegT/DnrJ/EryC1/StrS family aminotransferase, partial [candidate division KSB1 bacterium]|nr:DegT/DnrJ/EryC1/StrS family aminotransferase [candidate division KSB1 bacterium]
MIKVEYSYLQQQFADPDPILESIKTVVATGDYTLGKPVQEFEEKFAALIGTRYAIGVNSGTDALFLSLKALEIGPGDEVITAPNTFIATVGAIVATGAKPVFVDVTQEFTLDPQLIESAITSRTKAIMPVHYAGHPADMTEIMEIAHRHGIQVIEDACQAIGAQVDGRTAGTYGAAAGFSLHPLKNLNVWGDSGIIVTDSKSVRDALHLLRNHGLCGRDEVKIFGYNSRLDSIQAVVGNHLIQRFEEITETRIKWAQTFDRALASIDAITLPPRRPNKRTVYHLYMIAVERRDELLVHLQQKGIEA